MLGPSPMTGGFFCFVFFLFLFFYVACVPLANKTDTGPRLLGL